MKVIVHPPVLLRGLAKSHLWSLLSALLLVAAAGCSAAKPAAPSRPADVCGSGAELYPTAANAVEKTSADLRGERPPFAVSLVPTVPIPVRLGDRLGFKLSSSYCQKLWIR